MKYKELLGIAVETHIGNQMYSGEIDSVGFFGSSIIAQEYLFYLKYLFMAEKELYEAISPFVYDTWCLRVYNSGDTYDKFSSCDLKGTLFKIKSVSIVFPERSRVKILPEIPRSEMATLIDLDKQGITLNKKMAYSVNTGNSITVYSNITPYRTIITWLPSYWSLLNKKDDASASDALKDKMSLTEQNSKANADLNYDKFDQYLDYEVITPEQYHELLFNGLLVYLYRNKPTFQASVKERLAYELWEEGKKKARYISTWNSVLTQ